MKVKTLEHIHLKVTGKVQGVGFRYATLRTAESLGLYGWVRNLVDGSVEVTAEGPTEDIEALLEWCKKGPTHAGVENIEVFEKKPIPKITFEYFQIT